MVACQVQHLRAAALEVQMVQDVARPFLKSDA